MCCITTSCWEEEATAVTCWTNICLEEGATCTIIIADGRLLGTWGWYVSPKLQGVTHPHRADRCGVERAGIWGTNIIVGQIHTAPCPGGASKDDVQDRGVDGGVSARVEPWAR